MRIDAENCRDPELLAAEVRRLREAIRRLAEEDATLSVCEGDVTVEIDGTLTDEEREAVEAAIAYMAPVGNYDSRVQATLCGLLERHCPTPEKGVKQDTTPEPHSNQSEVSVRNR